MKVHTFGGYVDFGCNDYGNTPIDFELTDEEYDAVMRHIEDGDSFSDSEDLEDLYNRVLAVTEQQIREELEEEVADGYEHGDGKDVLAYYGIGVKFEFDDTCD